MQDYAAILDSTVNKRSSNILIRNNNNLNGRQGRRLLRTDPEYYIQQLSNVEHTKATLARQRKRQQIAMKILLILVLSSSLALMRVYFDHMKLLSKKQMISWNSFTTDPYSTNNTTYHGPEELPGLTTASSRFLSIRDALMDAKVSDKSSFQYGSPHYQALDWIANRDTLQRSIHDPLLVQRYILALLYFATGGGTTNYWTNSLQWLQPIHECEWKDEGGIRNCDDSYHVTDISLWNNLHGTIPSELGLLHHLQVLYLSRNTLIGTIPTSLGQLHQLNYLGLQHNQLTGTIPTQLGNLTQLKYLGLERNDLVDVIPSTHPLCVQMKNLVVFSADCRGISTGNNQTSKAAEVECACCTECYRY